MRAKDGDEKSVARYASLVLHSPNPRLMPGALCCHSLREFDSPFKASQITRVSFQVFLERFPNLYHPRGIIRDNSLHPELHYTTKQSRVINGPYRYRKTAFRGFLH